MNILYTHKSIILTLGTGQKPKKKKTQKTSAVASGINFTRIFLDDGRDRPV